MTIEFKHIGTSLGTRATGKEIREKIESEMKGGGKVIFDFNGVNVVSNSFADETFAKLVLSFDLPFIKAHTTFKNTNPFVQQTVSTAFRQRVAQLAHQ